MLLSRLRVMGHHSLHLGRAHLRKAFMASDLRDTLLDRRRGLVVVPELVPEVARSMEAAMLSSTAWSAGEA